MAETVQRIAFLDHFSGLNDPRQAGKVFYPLDEVMLLALCGVVAGADDFVEISLWGQENLDFLRRFLPFRRGIPSHDALNDLFNALDHEAFRDSFITWAESLRAATPADERPNVVAVDGKTSRRTHDKAKGRAALHLVSAWATAQRLVIGQEAIDDKENEIIAIPRLLKMLELKGALVTIDAMGCQKDIANTIIDRGGDYLLPVKDNHPTLRNDIELFFTEQRGCGFANAETFFHETVDNDHGRLEIRRHWSTADIAWLKQDHDWRDLTSIGMIERVVEKTGKTETTCHFYISSLVADAVLLARGAREHWQVENAVHWTLDVTFHDDLCRLRTGHGPQNMAVIRHAALNLLMQAKGKTSLKAARKKAAWSPTFLMTVLTASS